MVDGLRRIEYRGVQAVRADNETKLEKNGRDPAGFPISKRVFLAVDERPPWHAPN